MAAKPPGLTKTVRKAKPLSPFASRVLGLLLPLGPVHAKAMFGGKPFTYQRPTKDGSTRAVSMSYCEAPDGTLTSAKRLLPWAERGLAAARRAAGTKPKKKRRT